MFCAVKSLGLIGVQPYLVSVEVHSGKGLPAFDIVGLPDTAVRESRDRVRSAVQNLGYPPLSSRVIANLAPADTRKQGAVYDLPILLALLCAAGYEQFPLEDVGVIGEIGLSGEVRGVPGVLPMVLDAAALGLRRVIVPRANATEAGAAQGVEVLCAAHAREAIDWFRGAGVLPRARDFPPARPAEAFDGDLCDVKGQEEARRALEVAAAGGHNLLLIGPPGSGKSMLARRLPGILPAMTQTEALETAKIHSVAGCLPPGAPLLFRRPFRAPHHSLSTGALAGGGIHLRPGEISLAHNGVLFLDELPEFKKDALEMLRQPLEDGVVSISRVAGKATYPSKFMLVGAMNPCPCGFFGHPSKPCTCSPAVQRRYLGRLSGPLLDRIDIHAEAPPIHYEQMVSQERRETSEQVSARVEQARERQRLRYAGTAIACNASLPPAMLDEACAMETQADKLLAAAFDRMGLSARGADRIRKLARTIADLDGAERIAAGHVAQAVQMRSLDRKYWGG